MSASRSDRTGVIISSHATFFMSVTYFRDNFKQVGDRLWPAAFALKVFKYGTFEKIINGWMPLAIFAKSSNFDVGQGSK